MAREHIYQAIILKKQPLGEGDELLTVFSHELGKLRAMAKSVKFAKSKLQYSLQTLFLIKLTVASRGSLPRVIGAEVLESFASIRENLDAAKYAFYALELVLKFTPDEQRNDQIFNLLNQFLHFLNERPSPSAMAWALVKFKIEFLEAIGLGLHHHKELTNVPDVGFSNSQGEFTTEDARDYQKTGPEVFQQFLKAKESGFDSLSQLPEADLSALRGLLSDFLNYHLERSINSERFLES